MKLLKGKSGDILSADFSTKSLISEGLTFKGGNLEGNGSITVNCVFIGDIHIDDVVIVDEAGSVSGGIFAKDIIIRGNVEGNVTANGKVHICDGGVLNGNISCEALVVESNAAFSGSCNMSASRSRAIAVGHNQNPNKQDSSLVHTA